MTEQQQDPIDPSGPVDGVMARATADLEDTADIALVRARQFFEALTATQDSAERIMNLRRPSEQHRLELWSYARTMDQIGFVLRDTINWLEKAPARMLGLQQKLESMVLTDEQGEASKSAPERAH